MCLLLGNKADKITCMGQKSLRPARRRFGRLAMASTLASTAAAQRSDVVRPHRPMQAHRHDMAKDAGAERAIDAQAQSNGHDKDYTTMKATNDPSTQYHNYQLITLSHFCELHGPKVILSTSKTYATGARLLADAEAVTTRRGSNHGSSAPDTSQSISSPDGNEKAVSCPSCDTLFKGGMTKLQAVSGQHVYTTTRYPEDPRLYTIARQACVRR